ncbi:uncharacterized protein [Oscarella lobularis]
MSSGDAKRPEPSLHYKAIANFSPTSQYREGTIELRVNDVVEVVDRQASGWWCVVLGGDRFGWVPSTYLEPCSDEVEVYMKTTMPLPLPTVAKGAVAGAGTASDVKSTAQPFVDGENGYITLRLKNRANRPDVRELAAAGTKPNDGDDDYVVTVEAPPINPVPPVPPRRLPSGNDDSPRPVPKPRNRSNSGDQSPRLFGRDLPESPRLRTRAVEEDQSPVLPPRRLERKKPLLKARSRDALVESPRAEEKRRHRPILTKIASESDLALSRPRSPKGRGGAFAPRQQAISEDDEAFIDISPLSSPDANGLPSVGGNGQPSSRCSSGFADDAFDDMTRLEKRSKSLPVELSGTTGGYRTMSEYLAALGNKEWFHGRISRQKAESKLSADEVKVGNFLVRESESQPGNYSISVKGYGEMLHFQIRVIDNGEMFSIEKDFFKTIDDIVSFYYQHAIFEKEGKRLKLGSPYSKRRLLASK